MSSGVFPYLIYDWSDRTFQLVHDLPREGTYKIIRHRATSKDLEVARQVLDGVLKEL